MQAHSEIASTGKEGDLRPEHNTQRPDQDGTLTPKENPFRPDIPFDKDKEKSNNDVQPNRTTEW